jgi:hypothetical protein
MEFGKFCTCDKSAVKSGRYSGNGLQQALGFFVSSHSVSCIKRMPKLWLSTTGNPGFVNCAVLTGMQLEALASFLYPMIGVNQGVACGK